MLERLREPFPAAQVKKNQDGLDYVSIDGYINRTLEVLGLSYDFNVRQSSVTLLPPEMKTRTGKMQFLAQVTADLVIQDLDVASSRSGVGADVSFDPDKAVKTAQAEAFKKAAHQFGIALELWDADHRATLAKARKLTTPAAMKQEVYKIARERTGKDKPTLAEMAKLFGVSAGDLGDEPTLRGILTAEGLL